MPNDRRSIGFGTNVAIGAAESDALDPFRYWWLRRWRAPQAQHFADPTSEVEISDLTILEGLLRQSSFKGLMPS